MTSKKGNFQLLHADLAVFNSILFLFLCFKNIYTFNSCKINVWVSQFFSCVRGAPKNNSPPYLRHWPVNTFIKVKKLKCFKIQSKIKTYIDLKLKQLQEILEPGPPLLFIVCISYPPTLQPGILMDIFVLIHFIFNRKWLNCATIRKHRFTGVELILRIKLGKVL